MNFDPVSEGGMGFCFYGGNQTVFLRRDEMKKLLIFLAMVSLVVISGCYRPSWYRADTTYAQLKSDSEWCKSQVNIGSTREETIDQYEKCMRDKGYQLKDKSDPSSGGEPIRAEGDTGPIVIDKKTKVYVGIYGSGSATGSVNPAYRYFHKKNCKHLLSVYTKEVTVDEAIASGKTMCPDCFRD
jgi:hypothetical protein